MPVSANHPGLRERKKVKTRQSIRREAFRLIEERGYASTTIEQIAQAADISPSTFFRYFPSKESVLLADDLSAAMLSAIAVQPADLSPIEAFRRAVRDAHQHLSTAEWEEEATRQRLIYSLPELRPALRDEFNTLMDGISEAMATRLGHEPHRFEVRVFAGAVIGAIMALGRGGPFSMDNVDQAMDFLEAGLPLI